MADALVSPAVGGTFWVLSSGLIAFCARKVGRAVQDHLVPLMGVMGAFVFVAQMINFSIPGTGSSGHIGGGLMLAILLGPHASFLVVVSVLAVQAFFFADGGLLALGCNIFNLGVFPAFVAYPLYRRMADGNHAAPRAWGAAVAAAVLGLLLGAGCVVLQTTASGITELPFGTFLLVMLPIHLAIGIGEGLATAAVVSFVYRARPAVFAGNLEEAARVDIKPVLAGLVVASVLVGGALSWFASSHPDGLEWSISNVSSSGELSEGEAGMHRALSELQEKTSFLPDYGFKEAAENETGGEPAASVVNLGTSTAGLVGGTLTLAVVFLTGLAARRYPIRRAN